MAGKIRLACMNCDRTDFDGVKRIPKDWESVEEAVPSEPKELWFCSNWWTHLGWCPECKDDSIIF